MAGHIHQPLLDAIQEFVDGYSKDERYQGIMDSLKGVVSGIQGLGPNADSITTTPGALAAKLAADPEHVNKQEPAKQPDPGVLQPKDFATATAAAKERMAAAR